jgi:hypothetical protein
MDGRRTPAAASHRRPPLRKREALQLLRTLNKCGSADRCGEGLLHRRVRLFEHHRHGLRAEHQAPLRAPARLWDVHAQFPCKGQLCAGGSCARSRLFGREPNPTLHLETRRSGSRNACPGVQMTSSRTRTLMLMKRSVAPELPGLEPPAPAAGRLQAPADVYYVVRTQGGIIGERQHCVSSSLYETSSQADAQLRRLVTANPDHAYSVWKGSTYIEPALWAYDVVLSDGTVLRPKQHA